MIKPGDLVTNKDDSPFENGLTKLPGATAFDNPITGTLFPHELGLVVAVTCILMRNEVLILTSGQQLGWGIANELRVL